MLHQPILIRPFAISFAVLLGLLAAWIMAAELARPNLAFFPSSPIEAQTAASHNAAAATAAEFGWPRGELWVDHAVTAHANMIGAVIAGGSTRIPDGAAGVAETAATLAPADPRAWLLLAANAQAAGDDTRASALLKMSYYTSPYSDALFPLRIQTATRSSSTADEELSSFVEYELGVAVGHKPDLRPAVAAAYRAASQSGRAFFDKALAKLDPNYLAQLKATKP